MELHYLTPEEEKSIKESIPWGHIERGIRDLVALANEVTGIATLQSCEGHIFPKDGVFEIEETHVAFRATKERTVELLFSLFQNIELQTLN